MIPESVEPLSASRWAIRNLTLGASLLCAILPVAPVRADTVLVLAALDNTLFESSTGASSNGVGPYFFVGENNQGNVRRGVLAFDVTGVLPANAVIDSVSLQLHLSNPGDTVERTLSAHRVLAGWGEGTSTSERGEGAESTAGDATWIHRIYPDILWTNPGGDFATIPSATATVAGIGFHVLESAGLADDVRAWVADPSLAFGWLLVGEENVPGAAQRFDSRENSVAANQPRLFVHYHSIPDPVLNTSWGRIKADHR